MKNIVTQIDNTITHNIWTNCRTKTMEAMFSLSEITYDVALIITNQFTFMHGGIETGAKT